MAELAMVFIVAGMVACLLAATFYAGMLNERIRWNGLIRDGILPKPRRL